MAISQNLQIAQARRYVGPKVGTQTLYGVNQIGFATGQVAQAVTEMTNIGASVCRFTLNWASMQLTSGGTIFWSGPDAIQAQCAAASPPITPLFVIEGAPTWANSNPGAQNDFYMPTSATPKANLIAAYATFVGQVVTRYGTNVLYQLWNEPNTNYPGSFWMQDGSATTLPDPAYYASLFSAGYTSGKAANSGAQIGLAGLASLAEWPDAFGTPGITYLTSLMTTSAIVCDAVAIHPYTTNGNQNPGIDSYPTGNSFKDISRIQTAMVANSYGTKPLWITEWGNYSSSALGNGIKSQYVNAALGLVNHAYGLQSVGSGKAGVTICCYYRLNNATNGTVDTLDTGLYTGTPVAGPNTILLAGSTFKTFTGA